MSDYRSVLEGARSAFPEPEMPIEGLLRRRDRRRRNRRIASGAVALAVVVAVGTALGLSLAWRHQPAPVGPPSPTPSLEAFHHNGPIAVLRQGEIVSVDPGTGRERRLFRCDGDCRIGAFDWSPDGRRLAMTTDCADAPVAILDVATGALRQVGNASGPCEGNLITSVDWSPDGSRLLYSDDADIFVIDADGSHRRTLGGGNSAGWSPDGSRIVFHDGRGMWGGRGVWIMDADGTHRRQVTADGMTPAWSPDGTRIAFVRDPRDPRSTSPDPNVLQLWVISPDGSHPRLLYRNPGCCVGASFGGPAWSPDATRIAVVFWPDNTDLTVVRADGSGADRVAKAGDDVPSWRPVP